jgi:hypothetical protein
MKSISVYFLSLLLTTLSAEAQKLSLPDLKSLTRKEDTLKVLAKSLYVETGVADRMRSDSIFIRTLVRALQIKHSFYYPFDSLKGISKLYAPDSSFKIFTWSLSFDTYSRQRGAIQMKTLDGSLKLIPLKDFSEFSTTPLDSVRSKDTWIGAVYYNMIKTRFAGKSYYTLFGFDPHLTFSNKKWIEVLSFDNEGEPEFGSCVFSFEQDSTQKTVQHRYSLEYRKEATAFLNYTENEQMILFSHLVSESGDAYKPYTFIPDGEYEGFKWKDGKWVHVENVFNLFGKRVSMEDLIRDNEGNINEKKLMEFSEKNIRRAEEKKKKSGKAGD